MSYTIALFGRPGPLCPLTLTLSAGTLYGFLLVLARVGGALIFVPLPGVKSAPEPARVALALGFTLALFPPVAGGATRRRHRGGAGRLGRSPKRPSGSPSASRVAFVAGGLRAGGAGARACRPDMPTPPPSTPTREADSGILLVFAQLMAGMLFFAMGLDREVLRLFAQSLEKIPPGAFVFSRGHGGAADSPGRDPVSRSACVWRCRWSRCW